MTIVLRTVEDLRNFFFEGQSSDNQLIGDCPELVNSKIVFADNARGNLLACGKNVRLVDTTSLFNAMTPLFALATTTRN